MNIREFLEQIYLEYVNNYLTVGKMAEDYKMDKLDLNYLIELGRLINRNQYEEFRNLGA